MLADDVETVKIGDKGAGTDARRVGRVLAVALVATLSACTTRPAVTASSRPQADASPLPSIAANDGRAAFERGVRALAEDQVAAAIRWLREAAQAEPNSPEIQRALAGALRRNGEDDVAIAHLQRACGLAPSTQCDQELGLAFCGAGWREDGLAAARRIESAGESLVHHVAVARIARACHEYGAAEAAYRRALVLAPDDSASACALAELLRREGRRDDARALLRAQIERHRDSPGVLLALARQLTTIDDLAGAEAVLERAYDLAPDDREIASAWVSALVRTGHCGQARSVLVDMEASFGPGKLSSSLPAQVHGCVDPLGAPGHRPPGREFFDPQ